MFHSCRRAALQARRLAPQHSRLGHTLRLAAARHNLLPVSDASSGALAGRVGLGQQCVKGQQLLRWLSQKGDSKKGGNEGGSKATKAGEDSNSSSSEGTDSETPQDVTEAVQNLVANASSRRITAQDIISGTVMDQLTDEEDEEEEGDQDHLSSMSAKRKKQQQKDQKEDIPEEVIDPKAIERELLQPVPPTGFIIPPDAPEARFVLQAPEHTVDIEEAVRLLRAFTIKNETLEASIRVSMHDKTKKRGRPRDPIRGLVVYPHGFKDQKRIVVFAEGKDAQAAMDAGASYVGGMELVDQIQSGEIQFDVLMSSTQLSTKVKQAGRVLRQNTPSAAKGTVTDNFAEVIPELQGGVTFKSDARGNFNIPFGKMHLSNKQILENFQKLIDQTLEFNLAVRSKFIQQVYVKSTQSDSLKINFAPLL